MAIQSINIGSIANDGTGDDLREAFAKVNNNFSELDNRVTIADGSDAANIGGGTGIFSEKIGNELQFKSIVTSGISISNSATEVTLTSDAINQLIVVSDSGSIVLNKSNASYNLYGGTNIDTRVSGTQLFVDIDPTNLVQLDLNPTLGGNLDANQNNISNAATITSDGFVGPLTGLVYGIDVRDLNGLLDGFDFGKVQRSATNLVEWLNLTTDVDYGSFLTPEDITSDFGAFV